MKITEDEEENEIKISNESNTTAQTLSGRIYRDNIVATVQDKQLKIKKKIMKTMNWKNQNRLMKHGTIQIQMKEKDGEKLSKRNLAI
jgi:hypothetical protein